MPDAVPPPRQAAAGKLMLPVLDVTHPAFASGLGPQALAERVSTYLVEERRRQRVPGWLTSLFLRLAGGQSYFIRTMAAARAGYLPGLTTYMLKLGPQNLVGPMDNDIDRKIAASLPAESMRLRLEQVARPLAEAIAPRLAAAPGRPLHLLNIAGGPAIDSLNALIVLRQAEPDLLAGRPIAIHVLDPDTEGPAFGRAALASLTSADGPLLGLTVDFSHVRWNWQELDALETLLATLDGREAVVAASTEGGLFEYGSDAEITDVLRTLATGVAVGTPFVGSVTRADAATRLFVRRSPFPIVPRGVEAFAALAAPAGWRLTRSEVAAFSDQVVLERS